MRGGAPPSGCPGLLLLPRRNMAAGHFIATFTVLVLLHAFGACIWSRALAMALMICAMLFTDSVHPPGGALVLMAVDSHAIQTMDWWVGGWVQLGPNGDRIASFSVV